MGDRAWIIDPPLIALPAWGWPQPLWWCLILVGTAVVIFLQRRKRLTALANAPWKAWQQCLWEAVQHPHADKALLLGRELKRALLHYLPRERVARLRVDEAWTLLCHHCGVKIHPPTQQWLADACYSGQRREADAEILAHLRALAQTLQNTPPPADKDRD